MRIGKANPFDDNFAAWIDDSGFIVNSSFHGDDDASVDINGKIYYKNGSTITVKGKLYEIEVSGFDVSPKSNENIIEVDKINIKIVWTTKKASTRSRGDFLFRCKGLTNAVKSSTKKFIAAL